MEDLEQVKNKINLVDYIEKTTGKVKNLGGGTFSVEPCPVCNHKNHFRINNKDNYYQSFNGCCKGGDILNYMQEIEHLSFLEAKEKLYKITNTPLEEYKIKKEDKKQTLNREELERINNFVMQGYNQMLYKEELIQYLKKRNINQEAIEKYHLFISNDTKGIKRLYIPILEDKKPVAYIGRAIEDNKDILRYNNSKGTIKPFNLDYLKEEVAEDKTIYICEGIFDAISIEEQGKKAIALNSTNNVSKLIEAIKSNIDKAKEYLYIIASDNDQARRKSKKEFRRGTLQT